MGQKVHPYGFRLGINKPWKSNWFGKRDFPELLQEDIHIRKFLRKNLSHAGVSGLEIERSANRIRINIHTARPGIIIGKKGLEVDRLKEELQRIIGGKQVNLNIKEIRRAELDARLVAQNIALQLEKRISFRRAMKKSVQSSLRFGALGIKIRCSGRLGGNEIARSEWYREGRVPLHTLRADIDYGTAEAMTTYGIIGIKVWVYKGEIFEQAKTPAEGAGEGV
ncbi:MAG: 30S ribosomal protein S3 [Nitrospinaceae bacterium]|nr:30S ribosomal protein S3 [Nitrospinaceae bacterium]NIR55552.1 30S ribosomal protein S3 [Nitrospinaceae bacterium]NIS85986.1 30S ribosomal protein S3 [Nitrospinaceae bacterium]NIT82832.1 30S ribosomal protein S3 [Nitrospinaceae bacterium]NIU45034.1 30S ribosomal protein S3 [Nitrospinaceae bacterium]